MRDPVAMYLPSNPSATRLVERDAYRETWYDKGWRSDDDVFVGSPTSRRYREFISRPAGWGERWRTARRETDERLVSVCIIGDSISGGETASNWLTHGYVNLVRQYLQSKYGDGGSGFVGLTFRALGNPGGGQVTETGAWTNDDTENGITRMAVRPTAPGSGATMTFPVRGTIVDIWFKTYNGSPVLAPTEAAYGTFDYRIDAGAWVPVNLNQATGILKVTVSGLSAGDHTVTIRATTGTGKFFGVSGRNATGLVINNMSYSGSGITNLGRTTKGMTTPLDTAENTMAFRTIMATAPHDLVIHNLGGDTGLDVADDTLFQSELWNGLNVEYNAIQKAGFEEELPDVAVVLGHTMTADIVGPPFNQYERDFMQHRTTQRQFAETVGAAVIDVHAAGGRSVKLWDDLGFWGGSPGGVAGPDQIHPSNAGHREIANLVIEAIR